MYLIRKFSKFSTDHLSELQLAVTQLKSTEPPYSSDLLSNKYEGSYSCIVCNSPLFSSKAKFDSGSGWPSFYESLSSKAIYLKEDYSHGMTRTEVLCSTCGSHLGHFFPDGPQKRRYCINGCSLKFDKLNNS